MYFSLPMVFPLRQKHEENVKELQRKLGKKNRKVKTS
jgi:hypothetical protein